MVTLSTIQTNLRLGNIKHNTQKIFSYLIQAHNGIVLIPEMFSCGFDNENLKKHAERTPEIKNQLEQLSLENNLVIAGTLPEETLRHVYNTGFIIERGKTVYEQQKNKLFPLTNEPKYFAAKKQRFEVTETQFGRLGIVICFELRFPEFAQQLRKKGIEILLVPAQWGKLRAEHFKTLQKARAIETQSFVVSSNVVGMIDIEYAGHSSIYDPWGRELVYAQEKEGMFSKEIDLSEVYKTREMIPMGRD